MVCLSCSFLKQTSMESASKSNLFKIKRIDNYRKYHILFAERNDSIFKIITTKDTINTLNYEKFCVGRKYNLDLKVIFPTDSLFGIKVMPNSGIKGIIMEDGIINVEKRSHYKLYEADNLKGLYIKTFPVPNKG